MRKIKCFILFASGILAIFFFNFPVSASEADFADFLNRLKEENVIPQSGGKLISIGDYEDSYANMGTARWFTFTEASHYVYSAKISWQSASLTPTGNVSGCGLIIGADPDFGGHLLASIRMDGKAYLVGKNNFNTELSYGSKYVTIISTSGEADMAIVVDGTAINYYINGELIISRPDVILPGNGIGFAVLSGTNKDYGTKCTFEDVFLYKW